MTSFSQKDTIPDNKCFPTPLVRLIIKDLLSGDSAKAMLKLSEEHIDSLVRKTYVQDSVIGVHQEKEKNFDTIIGYERDKFGTLQTYTTKIEGELKTEKAKSKLLRWANYGLIGALGLIAFILK